ncbi:hypothetical protein CPter291_4228 [Collimonas pratensis]|uniref:Uncharacterized protein n=1 Tax=Collimonas pratensis TaxID=279113 RepID=A0ABN4MDZ3_9BURK|nr:hypothetical protein CPter291_4228 [Collimonas pratensis]
MHYCVNCLHLCHVASGLQNVKLLPLPADRSGLPRNTAGNSGTVWRLPSG